MQTDNDNAKQLVQQIQLVNESFNLDSATFKLTQEFGHQYLRQSLTEKDCIIIPRLAMWLASRQQQIIAIDGSLVIGSGIQLNSVLYDCQQKGIKAIDEICEIGMGMVNDLKVDNHCYKMLSQYKTQSQVLKMFYLKLEQQLAEQQSQVRHITWLIFLIAKKQLKSNDVVWSTCILVSILTCLLQQLQPTTKSLQNVKNIEQHLIQAFKIKDLDLYQNTDISVKSIYSDLIKNNIIKQLKASQGNTIFAVSIITSNLYKLDVEYNSMLKPEEFDERLLIPDRQRVSHTPKKMTPMLHSIKQQMIQSKYDDREPSSSQNTRYQKMLNYELDSKVTIHTNLKEIKLPQTVLMSPYAQQQIIATPMTEAMEMYNWIHDKQLPFKKYLKNGSTNIQQFLQTDSITLPNIAQSGNAPMIDNYFNNMIQYFEENSLIEINRQKRNFYWTLFTLILEKQNIYNEDLYKSLLVTVIEAVNYILTKSNSVLEQLIQKTQIAHFQVWKQLDFIIQYPIPFQLKEHLLDVETKFISYNIWACDSQSDLISFLNEINSNKSNPQIDRLFKRVLHYCAYQIQIVGNHLKINEQLQEYIWITMKYIICEKADYLRNHSLDQLVLATIYAILKITNTQIKFQSIINSYEQTNTWFTKQFIKKIVCNVYISHDCMGDIVQYYNSSYIPEIKSFLLKMTQEMKKSQVCQSPLINKNPALNNRILSSPLREVLPQSQCMTPATQLLYAYQESPLLKQQTFNTKFAQSKENSMNALNMQKVDYSSETQEFIMKKFEQIKSTKSKPIIQKPSFSIMQQGQPKVIQQLKTARNNSFMSQQNQSNHSHTDNNGTFCKLLNYEA